MYSAIYNDSARTRKSLRSHRCSLRTSNNIHQMITLTMVVIIKIFTANSFGFGRQIYGRPTIFVSSFTASTLVVPAYARNLHGQQHKVAPKMLPSFESSRARRQYISFALSDSSGRTEEPVVVLEDVDEDMAVPSALISSSTTATSTITPTTETVETLTPFKNGLTEKYTDSASSPTNTVVLTDAAEFIRPDRDLRSYRFIQLANNLRCLLVCDNMKSGTGIEAASLHVQAGHFDDTIPGLARTLYLRLLFSGADETIALMISFCSSCCLSR
jgi:hypothetical protein